VRPPTSGIFALAAAVAPILLSLSLEAPACAEPTGVDRARATSLFNEGRELMTAHRTTEACEKFDESEKLDPGGGTLMNLARCREEEGRIATAWSEFTQARAEAAREGREDREAEAKQHVASLEPRLSKLTIVVDEGALVDGLAITIDGSPVGRASWSTPFPVDGGDHAIEVSAPGKVPYRTSVRVEAERDVKSVTISKLANAPVAPSKTERSRAGNAQLVLGVSIGAAAAVELAVGTYFGVRALSKQHESDTGCPQNQCSSAGVAAAIDAGRSADASTVLVSVGVVSAALGVTLVVTRPQGSRVAIGLGPGRASVSGTF